MTLSIIQASYFELETVRTAVYRAILSIFAIDEMFVRIIDTKLKRFVSSEPVKTPFYVIAGVAIAS